MPASAKSSGSNSPARYQRAQFGLRTVTTSVRAVTILLLIAAVWVSLGIGVIVVWNVVKGRYARHLGATTPRCTPGQRTLSYGRSVQSFMLHQTDAAPSDRG